MSGVCLTMIENKSLFSNSFIIHYSSNINTNNLQINYMKHICLYTLYTICEMFVQLSTLAIFTATILIKCSNTIRNLNHKSNDVWMF